MRFDRKTRLFCRISRRTIVMYKNYYLHAAQVPPGSNLALEFLAHENFLFTTQE